MADLHDVESSLRAAISRIVYPQGSTQPSITGLFTKVIRGWPQPNQLDADLKANRITVSIFPQDNESRTTRYPQEWQTLSQPAHTLVVTASGTTITVSGISSGPANVAAIVDGRPFVYAVQPGDTTNSVAAGLSGLIDLVTPSSVAGSTVTIPHAHTISARVGGFGTIIRELRRQKRGFQITCWCPTPESRDVSASAIDVALAQIDFLALPDGTAGRILYERSHVDDGSQEVGLYRRDLFYSVEYGTTQTQDAAEIVVEQINVTTADSVPLASIVI